MPFSTALLQAVVFIFALPLLSCATQPAGTSTCKCIPGDECWPSPEKWRQFNASVGGRLVSAPQLAAACHDPTYDNATCTYIRTQWAQPAFHDKDPSSIMAAAVANKDCDPFTPREQPCLPGQSVAFSVNASGPADFARAIRFAQSENIRLVIHNTGHDYLGKSTGKGALSVWTHYMKDVQFVDYSSAYYTGPAIKLGAGVQVEEAYEAAHQKNALVVGGDCATVGVVGGYLQGGGHSALSSLYGLAADHTLEWEVVDGTGRLHIATPERNADLYWALSGGGGGTYGIASSVTIKLHPDLPLTGVVMSFDLDPQHPQAFHRAVSKYHELVPRITASRGMGIAAITNSSFLLTPLTLPHVSGTGAIDLIMPLLTELDDQGVRYSLNITESPNWLEYWTRLIKPNPTQLVENGQYGGWMVPRSVVEADGDDLQSAVQHITDAGCTFVGLALNVSLPEGGSRVRNSVLPAWREAAMNVILSTPWPEGADIHHMKELAEVMTQRCVPALARLAPQAGAYMNEADPNQPDWHQAFYGLNYEKLLAIKNKYDPNHIFYAQTAVGSDFWKADHDGRLCRAHNGGDVLE